MAHKTSSASASRERRSSSSAASSGREVPSVMMPSPSSSVGPQIQPDQNPLEIRKIADDPPQGWRQFLDQGGHGDDLLSLGQHRLLIDVDHLEVVAPLEMLLADLLDIVYGACGALVPALHILTQHIPQLACLGR